jgi:tRNA A37 methylthiotransferase MiaB
MENNLSLHIKKFNDKVKLLNQAGGKQVILTAQEARSLQADILDLLSHCAQLSKQISILQNQEKIIQVAIDGGSFK